MCKCYYRQLRLHYPVTRYVFKSAASFWTLCLTMWRKATVVYCKLLPGHLHRRSDKTPKVSRCNRWIFIADLIACSKCFGHHYAHHQELESITQVVAACRIWCLVFKLSVWYGAEGCVGIMVPETFWASNKICNKNSSVASSWHFFPHIIDDARSKPHQTKSLIQNNLCPSWGFELL